jgi:hypothetical protein
MAENFYEDNKIKSKKNIYEQTERSKTKKIILN